MSNQDRLETQKFHYATVSLKITDKAFHEHPLKVIETDCKIKIRFTYYILIKLKSQCNSQTTNFSACDITIFPGLPFPGANGLTATVPDPLAVGTEVMYTCMDMTMFAVMPPTTSNQCDGQGMYGPVATCVPSK